MIYHEIGNTGISISEIGFGTIPILSGSQEILSHYYNLREQIAINLIKEAFDHGITFFDTAVIPEYGDAERKLGLAFKEDRDKVIISSKARAFTRKSMEIAIETSLRNLSMDYIDIYFIHQIQPKVIESALDEDYGAIKALIDAKKKGYIREIGVGVHYANLAAVLSTHCHISVIQLPYNILETGLYNSAVEIAPDIKKKIIFHKVFGGGVLTPHFPINNLIKFALEESPLSIIVGIGTKLELLEIISAYKEKVMIPNDEFIFANESSFLCNRCQKCKCHHGIRISHILRYRAYFLLGFNRWAHQQWSDELKLEHCSNGCKDCITTCPRHIDIPKLISETNFIFNNFGGFNEKR